MINLHKVRPKEKNKDMKLVFDSVTFSFDRSPSTPMPTVQMLKVDNIKNNVHLHVYAILVKLVHYDS